MTKKILYSETKTFLDNQTGLVKQTETTSTCEIEQEPGYVKLYLAHIIKLKELPKGSSSILYSLLKIMGFDNIIVLNASLKRMIAKEQNTSVANVANIISKFVKDGLMVRKDTGLYMLDPKLFAKGKWRDIDKLRTEYLELSIKYHPDGAYTMESDFIEGDNKAMKAI